MEALLTRYRNLTVLFVVVVAQLLYLAWQVKSNRDERLIRVWAVSAVTPMAGVVEAIRRNTIGFMEDYFILLDVREQNRRLKSDNDNLRMENVYLRSQLDTAEHAKALILFQQQTPSKTVAARVIGNSTVATAKAVFVDRGATSGIRSGMAVVTPEGVVGKVTAVYPLVAQVLLVTDPTFKVGVESQKGHVHGVLDCGSGKCIVEQIQNEDKVDAGEWFFTSGEDRIFPRGFPVGTVVSSKPGQGMRDVNLHLSGAPGGVEQVLVVLQGVHQQIPSAPVVEEAAAPAMPPPPADTTTAQGATATRPQTEADKIVQHYSDLGKAQNHEFGAYGSNMPNFNAKPANSGAPATTGTAGKPPLSAASGSGPTASASATQGSAPKAVTPAPAKPAAPGLLGARPGTQLPAENAVPNGTSTARPKPAAPTTEIPGLLGAPKRKPVPANVPKAGPSDE